MLLVLAGLILWIVAGGLVYGDSGQLETEVLNESAVCGECHEQIYAMWQRSMHSASLTDPIFQTSYMRAYFDTQGKSKALCLRCHAPVAFVEGDLDLENPKSREGITCDYCHSVTSVDLERQHQPIEITLDGVKRGPLADAESPVHEVAKSELHQSAEFCAGCHEYANEDGLLIFSTYSEWRLSPQAAEGTTCQHCHMPLQPGNTVRPDLGLGREGINLHNISGGHSPEQIRKAATATLLRVERQQPTSAVIEIEVANVGSGHSIPTGLPTRKLVLEVTVYVGGREVRHFERVYQRALLDANRKLITEDHRVILDARSVLEDNRIKPGERRLERFVTSVPSRGTLRAEMKLRYLYEPQLLSREKMSIEITSDRAP